MTAFSIATVDEGMHEPTDDPQFNESMYFNFVDADSGFATLIRMGNRVNEGYAEVTVLIYLPDGGAAIRFDRAPITSNAAFDTAGLRFEVVEPLDHMRVTFEGDAYRLASSLDLTDPKKAFTTSPLLPLTFSLDYRTIALHGMGGTDDGMGGLAGGLDAIATGHYQGPCRVAGTVILGDEEIGVEGLGFRDHSWGPRKWQGPSWWRWISCLVDDRNGFVAWLTRVGDQIGPASGMVLHDGEISLVRDVSISSTYDEEAPYYPGSVRVTLRTDAREYSVSGRMFATVPLRHRRDGTVARILELLCSYQFEGRVGYGISEYHDLMIDGMPAGRTEA